MLIWIYM